MHSLVIIQTAWRRENAPQRLKNAPQHPCPAALERRRGDAAGKETTTGESRSPAGNEIPRLRTAHGDKENVPAAFILPEGRREGEKNVLEGQKRK